MELYRKALEFIEEERPFALGMVVEARGSTPQKPGSKAILDEAGHQWGTLGGGLVEGQGLESMKRALEGGPAELFEFRFDAADSRDPGSICGGIMRVFANARIERNEGAYRAALEALDESRRGLLLTTIEGNPDEVGRATWVHESEVAASDGFPGTDELSRCLENETPGYATSPDGQAVFIEPLLAPPRLLLVGGGHIGQVVAHTAASLGFRVAVLEDRPEFARPELFPPETEIFCEDVPAKLAEIPKDRNTYIVLVSRGHRTDAEALAACIESDAAYIGLLGSKRKIHLVRRHFIEDGLATEEQFDRIAAPIGVDIGAVTVAEIGVSIAAELVAARRLGSPAYARPGA